MKTIKPNYMQTLLLLCLVTITACKGSFDAKITTVKETVKSFDKDAPIAAPISVPSFNEDTQSIVTLSYADPKNEHATACEIKSVKNVAVSQACACLSGVCTVGIKGLQNLSGSGSFIYTVSKGTHASQPVGASLNIIAVNDAPSLLLASASSSIAHNGSGSVAASISDVDNTLACSNIALSSNNSTLIPSANLSLSGSAPNCSINIKAGSNQSGSGVVTALLSDGSGGSLSKTINVTVASAPVVVPPAVVAVTLPAKIEAENFVRYYDTSAGSMFTPAQSAGCRTGTDVDLEISGDTGGTCNVGYGVVGEYLEYDISSATAKNYDFSFRLATNGGDKYFKVQLDGVDIISSIGVVSTDWQIYNDYKISNVPVSAGNHVLRFVYLSSDINFNYFTASAAAIVAVDNLAVANGVLTPASLVEDSFGSINLGYTDQDGDKATACSVSLSSNLVLSSPCTCDTAGVCTVGIIGAANYTGSASFNYTVTTNGKISSPGLASLSISAVNDAPNLILAINSLSLVHNGSGSVSANASDIDSTLSCSSILLSSNNTTLIPISNLSVTGSNSTNCLISIKAGLNQSGSGVVTAQLTDGAGAMVSQTINVVVASAVSNPPIDGEPKLLNVVNHWIGNTGGKGGCLVGGDAISNFFTDMTVVKASEVMNISDMLPPMTPSSPIVLTKSFWDETNCEDGFYFNGKRAGKNWYREERVDQPGRVYTTSLKATQNGLTATIVNFYGRAFHGKLTPPPTGASAPYISLSDGRRIDSVVDPTAVSFDNSGRLWVADNGPDQNFKIFNLTGTPTLVDSFGEVGGVYAGPRRGLQGAKRFWGPIGVGFGEDGSMFLGATGMPAQVQGGTDIRAFSSAGVLQFGMKGMFMHSPDIDPSSDGTRICTAAQCFKMDYSKPPGQSWQQESVTLDPFRFVDDPRLAWSSEVSWVRVVNGQKYLFASGMLGDYMAVYRFEKDSEIAIPAAYISIKNDNKYWAAAESVKPVWENNETNKARRWMWRDANGNGKPEKSEFSEYYIQAIYATAFDVDENGNIWLGGGLDAHSEQWNSGGQLLFPFNSADANGVPNYSVATMRNISIPASIIPASDYGKFITRIIYLAGSDTLILAVGDSHFPHRVYIVEGVLTTNSPRLKNMIDLGHDYLGMNPQLDVNMEGMVIPMSIASDGDYLYVTYLDNGLDLKVRGEVTVYNLQTGKKVGWFSPGKETGYFSGAIDIQVGMHVRKRSDGSRVIVVEENGGAKAGMVYLWKP